MDPGKDNELINQCCAKNTLHSNDFVISHAVNNCEFFVPMQYTHELNREAESGSSTKKRITSSTRIGLG
jgi:hypothetical protein